MQTTEYYQMTSARAEAIARAAGLTVARVREYCLADWPEGAEHQRWLDTAAPAEIAAWIMGGP